MYQQRNCIHLSVILIIFAVSVATVSADIALPKLFSDHMVLQQQQSMRIRGTADSGEKLTIKFADQKIDTVADDRGNWSAIIQTGPAGGPHQLEIASRDSQTSVVFHDVLVGEVWVCGGQSNMLWPIGKTAAADSAVEQAKDFPNIRVFNVEHDTSTEPRQDFDMVNPWFCCSPDSIKDFSAVAYFFGRELSRNLRVPIGLINVSRQGTTLEAWTPYDVLENESSFSDLLEHWQERNEPNTPNRVSNSFNAMVAPLKGFAFRGIIWYQGEANVGRGAQYRRMFPLMIDGWRNKLGQKKCPFLFVQLAPYRYREQTVEALPEIWDAQLRTFKQVAGTGMVVTTDVGDETNLNPDDKLTVAVRLAKWAMADCYSNRSNGNRNDRSGTQTSTRRNTSADNFDETSSQRLTAYCGPIYESYRIDGNRIIVSFRFAEPSLQIEKAPENAFSICGPDKKFVAAQVKVDGSEIVVYHPGIADPVAVRYNWLDTPRPVLKNSAGLPASPFRTDDFPLLSDGIEF